VLKALAHPLRLRVAERLRQLGPAPVSRLAAELDVSLPDLSTALRVLRSAGVVDVEREGRTAVYSLAPGGVDRLLPLLDRIAGARPAPVSSRARVSRTCYDHLAGPLGVALYRSLLDRGAVVADEDGAVLVVQPEVLARFGVGEVSPGRRRLAFECLDATEHAPHLGGALGDALATALLERGWIERVGSGREVSAVDGRLERLLSGDDA